MFILAETLFRFRKDYADRCQQTEHTAILPRFFLWVLQTCLTFKTGPSFETFKPFTSIII